MQINIKIAIDGNNIRRLAWGALAVIGVAGLVVPPIVWARTVTLPQTFVNGTIADADEVNANFAEVVAGVNDNAAKIEELRLMIEALEAGIPPSVGAEEVAAFLLANHPNEIRGPQGPQGEAGPQGPEGPPGDTAGLALRVDAIEGTLATVTLVLSELHNSCVESDPENRFVDNGNGTVSDTCTGLTWEKQVQEPSAVTWQDAVTHCANLELAGASDWRLPTVKELSTLQNPYSQLWDLDITVAPGFPIFQTHLWSSTDVHPTLGEDQIYVGQVFNGLLLRSSKGTPQYVLAIRGP